jgi:hypothetical protein
MKVIAVLRAQSLASLSLFAASDVNRTTAQLAITTL